MGQQIEPVLEEIYGKLNEKSRDSLRLYAEFLLALQRQKDKTKKTKKKKGEFLSGLAHIPVPVDNVIIDRADIYADRF